MSDKHELRKLDVWIGEHLYGLRPGVDWNPEFELISESLPWFSSNPASAMRVLEKCVQKVHELKIQPGTIKESGVDHNGWWIGSEDHEGQGDTLPEAICRFARAVHERMEP